MSNARSLTVLGVLALAACAEPTTTALTSPLARTGSIAYNTAAAGEDTYLIRFNGNGVPADFEASVSALGGSVIFAHAGVGIAAVSGLNNEAADALSKNANIAGVDPDAYTTIDPPDNTAPIDPPDNTVASSDVLSPTAPNTAAFYARQWHLRAISAHTAWAAGKLGSATTKVGILDTGLGYTHTDLAGRVDLASSVSFLSAAENARVQLAHPGAHPVADLHYHGTHVGATVASNANAAAGVTSRTTLVGIKVCAPGFPNDTASKNFVATCPTSAVLAGVLYATDIGLPVINMSLGGLFLRRQASSRGGFGPSFLATINAVFHYANKNGTQVVVAAGNTPLDLQHFGAGLFGAYCDAPDVICVSATGPTSSTSPTAGPWFNVDAIASYSTFGKNHVTVAAPGGTAAGRVWAACSRHSIAQPICQTGTFILGLTGTSMASPHTAGLAALIAAEGGHTPASITQRITSTADDLGPIGKDAGYGHGRINVARALGLQ